MLRNRRCSKSVTAARTTVRSKAPPKASFGNGDDSLILFSALHWNAVTLWDFYPNERGRDRFRISASGVQSAGKPVAYRIDAGPMQMGQKDHLIGYYDAPAEKPTIVEFVDHLESAALCECCPTE